MDTMGPGFDVMFNFDLDKMVPHSTIYSSQLPNVPPLMSDMSGLPRTFQDQWWQQEQFDVREMIATLDDG